MGWICPVCGTAKSPQVEECCKVVVPQTLPQVTATTEVAVKVLDPKASSSSKARFNYNDQGFTDFWSAYPLHKGKAAAFKRWGEAVAAGISPQLMIDGALRYRNECAANPDLLVKYAEGWLHDGRWDDEPAPPRRSQARGANTHLVQLANQMLEAEHEAG